MWVGFEVDQGPEPEDTLLRFVAFGLGTFVCNGNNIIVPVLAERGTVSQGYEIWNPGQYLLIDQIAAAMGTGSPCSNADDFMLSMREGDAKTVILGFSNSFSGPPVVTDDLSAPASGEGRIRIWGRDRIGTGDLRGVEYCVDGAPLAGGSNPSTAYMNLPAGDLNVEVRIADGACGGDLRDTFTIAVAADEVRSIFLAPGTKLGPSRGISDVFIVNCLDSVGGTAAVPSSCAGTYAVPAG